MGNQEITTNINNIVDASQDKISSQGDTLSNLGSTPESSDNTSSTTTPSDPDICDQSPVSASEVCNMLATAEGNGTYTQRNGTTGASGRYQFITSTALGVIKEVRPTANTTEAQALWEECRNSSSQECKKLQDDMCANYTAYISRSLNNSKIPITDANRYLAWNQGTGGSRAIHASILSGEPVTNPHILKNMQGQAWDYSPDGKTFYNNMLEHLNERGVALV